MNKKNYSVLQFKGYKIQSFNYIWNNDFISKKKVPIDVDFSHELQKEDSEDSYSILLTCKINKNKIVDETVPFQIEISVIGRFECNNFDENLVPNAIAILFPYLRSIISTLTAQAGVSPFILPTMNINHLLSGTENK